MQLVWAENVVRKTNRPVLVLTPLAVAAQTVREGEKFGIDVRRIKAGRKPHKGINVTNYEQLHHLDPADYAAVVNDEAGVLKHFTSKRQKDVTEFMREMDYRSMWTATAAPNDHIELGTASEALGNLGRMDMLATFFKNDEDSLHPIWWGSKWRIKGHAEGQFWRWVCSWARACRKPSDLGFPDDGFVLPPLNVRQVTVTPKKQLMRGFFPHVARTLEEQKKERRATLPDRCERAAELASKVTPSVAWCHLNKEGDLLAKMIPGAVQVAGSDHDEAKEERFLAFADGQIKALVTKPKIGCFGMNWQHCHNMTFFPSHSFEQFYQSVRRCWRFGQKSPVNVHLVTTPGEGSVLKNLQRKARAADEMFTRLVECMNDAMNLETKNERNTTPEAPKWLK